MSVERWDLWRALNKWTEAAREAGEHARPALIMVDRREHAPPGQIVTFLNPQWEIETAVVAAFALLLQARASLAGGLAGAPPALAADIRRQMMAIDDAAAALEPFGAAPGPLRR